MMKHDTPDDLSLAATRCNLGMELLQQNRAPEAARAFEDALAIASDIPQALAALGKIYVDDGRYAEALRCLDRLQALVPDSPVAYYQNTLRGRAAMGLGRTEEAVAAFQVALIQRPDYTEALRFLGIALGQLGRPEEALASFERLCVLQPGAATAHHGRGMALEEMRRYDEAVAAFREALRLDPGFEPSQLSLGEILSALNHNEEALAAYNAVLQRAPQNAQVELARGDNLQILGRLGEAETAYTRAIALAPRWPAAYRRLFQVRSVRCDDDPALMALEVLLPEIANLPEDDGTDLHLALSKAYRELGRYADAFQHLREGNQRKRRAIVYDEADTLAQMCAVSRKLTPDVFQRLSGLGESSELPVFVLGMPRSGTSLVEQILASHSQVRGIGEGEDFDRLAKQRFGPRLEKSGLLSAEMLRQLGADYLASLSAKAPGAARIVDKTLTNVFCAGLIHLTFPKARIVHVLRDPMDTCFSMYSQFFLGTANFAYDLGELGRAYRTYQHVMDYWREVLPPDTILEIRYEALVENFEAEVRRLIAFCGLEWEESCLRFYETKRAVRTASAVQVRQPLFKEAVGRWKLYAEWLGPLQEALGD